MINKEEPNKLETLWCLPYDTESLTVPLTKISFSRYINMIISSPYFTAFKVEMAKELADENCWSEKSWIVLQFFEYLNVVFDISDWDKNINFIEEKTLRRTLGMLRLWIDTERLYLFNFIKLDSSEFQEDRIYMSLYRTLTFFYSFFSGYSLKDFTQSFLQNFFKEMNARLELIAKKSGIEAIAAIKQIMAMMRNLRNKEKFLVDQNRYQDIKKTAKFKVAKLADTISEVEARLQQNGYFHAKRLENLRQQQIIKNAAIDSITQDMTKVYDPISRMVNQYKFSPSYVEGDNLAPLLDKINHFKKVERQDNVTEVNAYKGLVENNHNPYEIVNYQIYGDATKVDMEKKKAIQDSERHEETVREIPEERRIYYQPKYERYVEEANKSLGKVTEQDICKLNKRLHQAGKGNAEIDSNTKIYNLKWHDVPLSTERSKNKRKDYNNNLFFKSPIEEHLGDRQKHKMHKQMEDMGFKSYTMVILAQLENQIHPKSEQTSFGRDPFLHKNKELLDLKKFRLVDNSKFDFMRKVLGYMAAQKKIANIINEKNTPDFYPRNYLDVRQQSYNPELVSAKIDFASGKTHIRPALHL